MKILVACEFSQIITTELLQNGHDAFSCDLLGCEGNHPDKHLKMDVRKVLQHEWDAILAFPPCTHLASSGARYFEQKRKDGRQQKAIDFFMMFTKDPRVKLIENPIGIMSSVFRKPDQIIQPYQFGEDASKATCLWLKDLPLLLPTNFVNPRIVNGKKRWANQTDSGQNKLPPTEDRAKIRSTFYPGIARAIANQMFPKEK